MYYYRLFKILIKVCSLIPFSNHLHHTETSQLVFALVAAVVAYSFFNSLHCSCSGSSMYFTFLSVISTLLFMLPLLEPFAIITLYLFLFLFNFLTHWKHPTQVIVISIFYDLALVLLNWLLTLLVHNFPYGDFIAN